MKYNYWLLLFLIPVVLGMTFHPIYISNTEINYKEDTKKIEIAIKIFSDDLQEAISKKHGTTIEIGTEREPENAEDLIMKYLQENFKIELNGANVPFEYVHRYLEKKDFFALWILVQVPKVRTIKSLKLYNNILIDTHSEQQNIINFREGLNAYKKFITYRGRTSVVLK